MSPVTLRSRATVGSGENEAAYEALAPWLSPVRSPSSPAARAAAATPIRFFACSSGAYAPIGRSMNAPFGIDARRLLKRSWVAGDVGNRKRTDVPSFMRSISVPRGEAQDPSRRELPRDRVELAHVVEV